MRFVIIAFLILIAVISLLETSIYISGETRGKQECHAPSTHTQINLLEVRWDTSHDSSSH